MKSVQKGGDMAGEFSQAMTGKYCGVLRWQALDELWQRMRAEPEGWYASLVGEPPPETSLSADALQRFVAEVDALLRREHKEDYCGIVYADDLEAPSFIKIYDPNNLGSSCGMHGGAHPPRWVLSRLRPDALQGAAPLPAGRKRWWQRILGMG